MDEPLPSNYTWMCTECFKGCVEIGMLAGGYSIILKPDGTYHILGGQGHASHELVCFPTKPWPDPDPECEAESGPVAEASDRWINEADMFEEAVQKVNFNFSRAAAFFNSCFDDYQKSEHNRFEYWVFHRAGELVEIYEGKRPKEPPPEPEPPPKNDMHWNFRVMRHSEPLPEHCRHDGHENYVYYAIHEYYYGLPDGDAWSCDPQPVVADSVEHLRELLSWMRLATMKEVIDYEPIEMPTMPEDPPEPASPPSS